MLIEVRIPFRRQFRGAMLSGRKTATSRTRRYGGPGDTFWAFGVQFEIETVIRRQLWSVARENHLPEGFPTPEAFLAVWDNIYPLRRSDKNRVVWFHVFRRVSGKENPHAD